MNKVQELSKVSTKNSKQVSRLTPKYDQYYIQSELLDLLDILRSNNDIQSKAHLFESKPYSYAKFNGWKAKYETNVRIHDSIKKIEEIIESRLVQRGLAGKAIPMTIFLLKNYYNYTDQYQQTVDTSISFKINRGSKRIETVQAPSIIDIPSLPKSLNK